jgi:hypothetical protein
VRLERGAAEHAGEGRLALAHVALRLDAVEQAVHRGADQLDVAQLFRRDVGDQRVERPQLLALAEIEALEHVGVERGHLAEAPAHQLLHRGGRDGSGSFGRGISTCKRSILRNIATPPSVRGGHRPPRREAWARRTR